MPEGRRPPVRRPPPFRASQLWHRALYSIRHQDSGGRKREWIVDVDLAGDDWAAQLYRDGEHHASAAMPARFRVPGGHIEVDASLNGVTRMHLVLESGEERRLQPARGTAEDLRARFGRRYPRVSRAIGWLAVAVLIIDMVLLLPTVLEIVTRIPAVAEHFETFSWPLALPGWLKTALVVAGAPAASERLLTWRHHRLIDAETAWVGLAE